MQEKSEFDKALGELYDLTEWEDAEAAIRELHARGPEIERLYLDSKILPGELRALVMVSNCLEREFIHRQLATGQGIIVPIAARLPPGSRFTRMFYRRQHNER